MINSLKTEVEKAFSGIIQKYRFSVKQLDKYSVYLVAESFAIEIYLDHDGLSTCYYDLSKNNQKTYDYFSFLDDKRREKLTFLETDEYADNSFIEQMIFALPFLANNIENAGSDILTGDKAWMKQYHYSTFEIPSELYAQLISK